MAVTAFDSVSTSRRPASKKIRQESSIIEDLDLIFHTRFFLEIMVIAALISTSVVIAVASEAPISKTADIGNGAGKFRFELHKIGSGTYERGNEVDAEIRIAKQGTRETSQRLPVVVGISEPWFEVVDINGDGYKDLLLYNACAGYAWCASPSTAADVFVYAPKLKKYVKCKTLSERGDITVLEKKGCVDVQYKCSDRDYIDEEWCFNLSTGRWKMRKSSGCQLQ